MIKRLNFQSYPVSEIYLFDKEISIRHTAAEFTNRINSEIKGDFENPSKIEIKYLDIVNGLQNVPDGIIHFGEA